MNVSNKGKLYKWMCFENAILEVQHQEMKLYLDLYKENLKNNPGLEKPVLNDRSFLDIVRTSYADFDDTKENIWFDLNMESASRLWHLGQIEKLKVEYSNLE